MPIVLVVDDSPVDRRLTGGLLGREKDLDWLVEYAEDGAAALALMRDLLPDVVVTDLIMPRLDGLGLVAAVRADYPQVPVVLVTGQGSEALALEALARGAASYVPKEQLADKLLDTVKQVLAVARADHSQRRLTECLAEAHFALELDNDPALVAPLVDLAQKALADLRFGDAAERFHLGIALEEAVLNALFHGTLALPAGQLRQARSELSVEASSFVRERRAQPPYRDRKIFVDVRVGREEARFVVRDEGPGFTRASLPERGDPKPLAREAGRGLVLMRNFMDEVTFNGAGNEVTLVKRRPRAATVTVGDAS